MTLPALLFADIDDSSQVRFLERAHAPLTVVSSRTALPEIARLLGGLAGRRQARPPDMRLNRRGPGASRPGRVRPRARESPSPSPRTLRLARRSRCAAAGRSRARRAGLYQRECASCHGPNGRRRPRAGAGGAAPAAGGRPGGAAGDRRGRHRRHRDARRPPAAPRGAAWWPTGLLGSGRRPVEQVPGDAAPRAASCTSARAGCQLCHALAGQGGAAGPDLTDIGAPPGRAATWPAR